MGEGEADSSPGCSRMSESADAVGACTLGGVEEALRAKVEEPLRDTHEVSITRTPILRRNTHTANQRRFTQQIPPLATGKKSAETMKASDLYGSICMHFPFNQLGILPKE